MNLKSSQPKKRKFYTRAFNDLWSAELYIKRMVSTNTGNLELTVLLKVGNYNTMNAVEIGQGTEKLETHWKCIMGPKINLGFFDNPEIGRVFIAGPLTEVFLFDIDGKKLAELSEGPYGILRGLGLSDTLAASHIKKNRLGSYLVLTRQEDFNGDEFNDL